MSATTEESDAVPGDIVYRFGDDLFIDGKPVGVQTGGPPRWRPGHPDEIVYVAHSDSKRSGVFLFEQLYLYNIVTGEERLILDIEDHGWAEAGHNDFDDTGDRIVFAAQEGGGDFKPHVLEVETGEVTAVGTETQVIDTVFAPDGRIMAIDTTHNDEQFEPVAWVGEDGSVEPLETSAGVNRDPVVSPDGRYVANIRSSGLLARMFVGRWDLIVTDLESGKEWAIGDGGDGFGPPRWVDDRTVVAKHGTYNGLGVISGVPDTATVDVVEGTIAVVETIPDGAWDPDPLPE
jgi:Tol biopolymer transport system component